MKGFLYERKVFYYEVDQMSIVHHSNYIRWMEESRIELLNMLGLSYAEMERNGLLIPVLSVSCEYKLPFRFGETFKVQVYSKSFNGIKCVFEYRILGEDGRLHTKAASSHCFTNRAMLPVSLKKSYPDIYEKMQKWSEENQVEEI